MDKEKGHAYTRQMRKRETASRQLWIDDGCGIRQFGTGQVVVGDNDARTAKALFGQPHLCHRGYAAVHGNQHRLFLRLHTAQQFRQRLFGKTVLLFRAPGDIPEGADASRSKKALQQARGGNAVHIIVAVNIHGPLFCPGLHQHLYGLGHAGHAEGIGQAVQPGVQKGPQLCLPGQAASIQNFHEHRGKLQAPGQQRGSSLVFGCQRNIRITHTIRKIRDSRVQNARPAGKWLRLRPGQTSAWPLRCETR